MKRKTGYELQKELEAKVNGWINKYGTDKTVYMIKNSTAEMFDTQRRYPSGVYVYCNSPDGGLLVGSKR